MTRVPLKAVASNPVERCDGSRPAPYVALEHLRSGGAGGLIPDADLVERADSQALRFRSGDVLFGKLRPYLHKVMLADCPGTCSGELLVIRPGASILPKYLYYVVLSLPFVRWAEAMSYGVKMPRTNWDAVRNFSFELPSLDAQKSLVDYLDHELLHLDAIIQAKERLISLLWERQRNEWREATAKPEHASEWRCYKVGLAFTLGSGTTPPTDESHFYGGDVPWILTGDLTDGPVTSTQKTITREALEELPALKIYPAGSLVIAMYGGATIGKAGLLTFPAAVNQACCVLQPRGPVDTEYAFYWFLANRDDIIAQGVGGGQRNISQDIIRRLRIWAPPFDVQRGIVARLAERTALTKELVSILEQQIRFLHERRRALITAAVTGQIDVTDGTTYARETVSV